MALQRLKEAAEKAKCELSTAQQTEIVLPFISADASGPKHLNTVLTRQKYEELTDDLLERTIEPCRRCLADAGLKPEQIDEVLLVGGQTRAPKVTEVVRKVFGKEPNRAVNPDEGVAMGAAIQTGIIQGEVKDLVLLDVTPHTLGIETKDGTFTPLIERNSTIPTRKSRVFTTVADNQTRVEVHVLQGESDMAAYNKSLAKFELTNIPPAPKGVPQIEVTFEIDVNGIVSVGAQDQATGRSQSMVIHPSGGLSQAEVEPPRRRDARPRDRGQGPEGPGGGRPAARRPRRQHHALRAGPRGQAHRRGAAAHPRRHGEGQEGPGRRRPRRAQGAPRRTWRRRRRSSARPCSGREPAGDVTATAKFPRCRAEHTRGDGVGGSYAAPHTPR